MNSNIKFVHVNDIRVNPYQKAITGEHVCDSGEQINVSKWTNSDGVTDLSCNNDNIAKANVKQTNTEIPKYKEALEEKGCANDDINPKSLHNEKTSIPKAYATRSGVIKHSIES